VRSAIPSSTFFRIATLTLVNELINQTEDLEERFNLRNEFLAMGINPVLRVRAASCRLQPAFRFHPST